MIMGKEIENFIMRSWKKSHITQSFVEKIVNLNEVSFSVHIKIIVNYLIFTFFASYENLTVHFGIRM